MSHQDGHHETASHSGDCPDDKPPIGDNPRDKPGDGDAPPVVVTPPVVVAPPLGASPPAGNAPLPVINGETWIGTPAADTHHGTSQNDKLYGAKGNDFLYGEAGDDIVSGGPGKDHLWGGTGNDVFSFGRRDSRDVVRDFEEGDRFDVTSWDVKFRDIEIDQRNGRTIVTNEETGTSFVVLGLHEFGREDFIL